MLTFDDDYPGRYQHSVKVDVPLPEGLAAPRSALLSVSQRDELGKASWSVTYDLLPVWPAIEARIQAELLESWRVHFEEWGGRPQGSELNRAPAEAYVDDCLGKPHIIAQLSIRFTIADDGDYDSAEVAVKITIDKALGHQLDVSVG